MHGRRPGWVEQGRVVATVGTTRDPLSIEHRLGGRAIGVRRGIHVVLRAQLVAVHHAVLSVIDTTQSNRSWVENISAPAISRHGISRRLAAARTKFSLSGTPSVSVIHS